MAGAPYKASMLGSATGGGWEAIWFRTQEQERALYQIYTARRQDKTSLAYLRIPAGRFDRV
jgi:hypothetical protein